MHNPNKNPLRRLLPAIAFVIAMVLVLLVIVTFALTPASAAPAAAPTPVSSGMALTDNSKAPVVFWYQEVITASGRGTVYQLPNYEVLDVHYVVDVDDANVNTTTLTLQYTNFTNLTNWVDGVNVAANVAADATGLDQFYNFGRYTSVYATVAGSDPVTITTIAVAK
jgi:hypothetical protein